MRLVASATLTLLLTAVLAGGAPATTGRADASTGRSAPVVAPVRHLLLVAEPDLRWADVDPQTRPVLTGLVGSAMVASLSEHTIAVPSGPADGYLTIGAGTFARLDASSAAAAAAAGQGADHLGLGAARRLAAGDHFDAVPGLVGDALVHAGHTVGVAGSPAAALALVDRAGHVGLARLGPVDPTALATVVGQVDVALVELTGTPTERDRLLAVALGPVDLTRDQVIVFSPSVGGARPQLGVLAVAGAGASSGWARSTTTRRDGFVTLPDVGAAVLAAFGLPAPSSVIGNPIEASGRHAVDAGQLGRLRAQNERTVFRDRTVGPVAVVLVLLLVVAALVAVAARRRRRSDLLAALLALTGAALVPMSFLSGLLPYRRFGLVGYTVALVAVSGAVAAAALLAAGRVPRVAVVTVGAFTWVVLAVDILTGGRLQIDTPLGYSPTVAGRFQGYGNLAFALLATTAVVVATTPASYGRARRPVAWAAALLAVTIVLDGLPALGADLGGVIALAPAAVVVVVVLTGRRVRGRQVVLAGVASIGLALVATLVDLARPASHRTHLGRFASKVLHGGAGTIVRRKLAANWAIFTSSPWTLLVPALVVGVVWLSRRPGGWLSVRRENDRGVRAALAGALVLAVVGTVANDSGVAVPAMMSAVLVPWFVALAGEAVG